MVDGTEWAGYWRYKTYTPYTLQHNETRGTKPGSTPNLSGYTSGEKGALRQRPT